MKEKVKSARGECWTYTELKIFYGLANLKKIDDDFVLK